AAKAEETILGILLLYPELINEIKSGKIQLAEEDFLTEFNRRVFHELVCEDEIPTLGTLGASFSTDEMARIVKMQIARSELSQNDATVLKDNIQSLRKEKLESGEGNSVDDTLSILQRKKERK
ncbi:MAG: hypothetical protein KBS76_05490, partial [Ruminococcus sp.]|nr:hypothetical protein [Candidatus Apopatosoma intestinale]